MIRFSVITIVRNDAVGAIRTLRSIFNQTYQNFELIVQDGASTDGTSDVLRGFGDWIDHLTIEKDAGVYDAMNRALRSATGDYCIFMNAGDIFVDAQVLENVAGRINVEQDDIWAGQVLNDEDGEIHDFPPPHLYWVGSTFDHQAAFIRTSLMQDLEYDTQYKVSGDLHFFTRARQNGARYKYENFVVARKPFSVGVSSSFVDRLNDRLPILEAAWGTEYPVRDKIREQFAAYLSMAFELPEDALADKSIAELLTLRDHWARQLTA